MVILLLTPLAPTSSHATDPQDLDWIRLRTDGITVYSSADVPESIAIVEGLLRFRDDCLAFLRVDDFQSPTPVGIYLLSSESAYEALCSASGSAAGTAGVFNPAVDASYLAIDLSASQAGLATVYHEYFHLIAERTMPTLPLWANEGLAEFFSTYEFDDGHGTVGHPIKAHREILRSEDPMPFVDLFAVTHMSDDYHGGARSALFYAQSWAVVHSQLTGTPAEREAFRRFLAAIAQGMSAQAAMIESMELDEQQVIDTLDRRENDLDLPMLAPAQRTAESVAWQTDEPTTAEVMNALGMFLVRLPRTHPDGPRHFFEEALKLDHEGFTAHLGLALTERSEHAERSRAHFARARELAPREPLVLDAYAEFLLDRYDEAEGGTTDAPAADLELARELFLQSLDEDPDGLRALAGYAMSFQYEAEIPADVVDKLDRAIARNPSRLDLLMARCIYTARRGGHEEAWSFFSGRFRDMRPGREAVQSVSEALVNAALVEAYNTAQSGRIEDGRRILEAALQRYGNRQVNREAWEQFAEAEAYGRHNLQVDRYNQGIDALNARDYERALEIMETVATTAADSALRSQAADICDRIRPLAK